MKKTSKALLLGLCAVLLVTASVLGTMAYLTSTDTVTNTFTVGNVAITLDEVKVKEDGTEDGTERVKANEYKLLPGHRYTKDPIVHVGTNSEDCYLFVKVENGIADIEIQSETESNKQVATQMTAKGWKAVDNQTGIYVYVGTGSGAETPLTVSKDSDVPVFENFTVDGSVTGKALANYADKTIKVTAYAIQADGFADKTVSEIWDAAGFDAKP